LLLDVALLAIVFRRQLARSASLHHPPQEEHHITVNRRLLAKCAIAAIFVLVLWFMNFAFALAAAAAGALILIIGRVKSENIYRRVNWELLLFFAALFVVMQGFQNSGAVSYFIHFFEPGLRGSVSSQLFSISGTMLVLANLISNVPAVILVRPLLASFGNSHFMWLTVASTSTLAGNATPISSVANLIVLQQAAWKTKINFWEFTRVGILVTIATTLLAIALLALEAHFFPAM
jgi:Na+/H+ antiporter NhaD/arsenite permease-like protein